MFHLEICFQMWLDATFATEWTQGQSATINVRIRQVLNSHAPQCLVWLHFAAQCTVTDLSLSRSLSLPFLFLPLSLPPSSLPLSLENPKPPHSPRLHCDNSCIHGHCCWTACFACHRSRNEATPADRCPSKAASASDHLPCLKTPTRCLQALARISNSQQSNDHTGFMTVGSSSCVQVWHHIACMRLIWNSWTPVVLLEATRAKKLTPPTSQGPRLAN